MAALWIAVRAGGGKGGVGQNRDGGIRFCWERVV